MDGGLLIPGLIFFLVMLLGLLAFYYASQYKNRKSINQRIRNQAAEGGSESKKIASLPLTIVGTLGKAVKPKKEADVTRMRKRLQRAGFHAENGPLLFFGFKVFTAFFLGVVPLVLKFTVLQSLSVPQVVLGTLLSLSAGFFFPDLYLYQRSETRKRKLFEGIPDALDLMVVCVEAGMGLDAAIKRVGDEMAVKSRVLGEEFRMLSLELRLGKPRADALRNLAMRANLDEVSSLVSLLLQTDKFGTRVALALRVHSDAMRTKRYQQAEEMAAKLPVKIIFPLLLFIFPSLFVTIIGPAVIRIYRALIDKG